MLAFAENLFVLITLFFALDILPKSIVDKKKMTWVCRMNFQFCKSDTVLISLLNNNKFPVKICIGIIGCLPVWYIVIINALFQAILVWKVFNLMFHFFFSLGFTSYCNTFNYHNSDSVGKNLKIV